MLFLRVGRRTHLGAEVGPFNLLGRKFGRRADERSLSFEQTMHSVGNAHPQGDVLFDQQDAHALGDDLRYERVDALYNNRGQSQGEFVQ